MRRYRKRSDGSALALKILTTRRFGRLRRFYKHEAQRMVDALRAGGVQLRAKRNVKLMTPELKAEVLRRLEDGQRQKSIRDALGVTKGQVAGLADRRRKEIAARLEKHREEQRKQGRIV